MLKKSVFEILDHDIIKRQTSKRWPVTAFTLTLALIFACLFWIHYRSLNQSQRYSYWVDHTSKVRLVGHELLITMLEAESGQRGYVVTGDERFLRPYYGTKRRTHSLLKQLKRLTADSPLQQGRIDTLYRLCTQRFTFLSKGILYRYTGQKDKAVELMSGTQGLQLMSAIEATINRFNQEEQRLLETRHNGLVLRTTISFLTLFIGASLILALITVLYYNCIRLINQLRKTQVDLFVSYELFSQTLLSVGDAAIATNDEGNVSFMNQVAEEITGKTMRECLGKPIEFACEMVDEKTRRPAENPARQALRTQEKTALANYGLMLKRDDWDYIFIDHSVAPINDDDGRLIGSVLVFRDVTEKSINLQKLQEAHRVIQEKNKNITDSILYAKSIQEALLPKVELLMQLYPEAFVLYKPKDIVSGDFYWFEECGDKLVIVAADCTGHGVPGALMSMIGASMLNEIVIRSGVTRPSEILARLHHGIRRVLKSGIIEGQANDGMDIAICSISRSHQLIEFSGSNRPLFYFSQGELRVFKGNKYGVGGVQLEVVREYTNYDIPYRPGDSIYLFTDGYQDQFGGERDKKMMISAFTRLLQSVQGQGMAEQKEALRRHFTDWKGDGEQTDDVLVIGLRL